MPMPFDAQSTADEVLAGVDLSNSRVLVTGVSAGLGVETARAFAARGADVIGTARNMAKAEAACEPIRQAAAAAGGSFAVVEGDLADLAFVRRAADELRSTGKSFDIVVANAGVMATPFGHTADGHELQFGTNVLGHQALLARIAPAIADGGRIVILSSAGHRYADVDLDDPDFERTPYDPNIAYGRSKTGDALLAVALDRRLRERGIRSASVHPGGIRTELGRHIDEAALAERVEAINAQLAEQGKPPFRFKSIPQGAATSVWAAVADGDLVGARYCENCHVAEVVGDDVPLSPMGEGVRGYAVDPERAEALWALCERMTGERMTGEGLA